MNDREQNRNEDQALDELISRLPSPPPVSSNFTSRVMAQIRLEARARNQRVGLGWLRLPRLAGIAAVASLTVILGFAILQHQRSAQREEMARTLQAVTEVVKKANPEASEAEAVVTVLSDFEAIRHLPPLETEIDTTLLTALTE